METWQAILLVLVALLVAPGVLALLELRTTLRELRVFLQDTGGRLNRTLDEAGKALQDLNRASASVQQGAERLRVLVDDLAGFGAAIHSVGDGIRRFSDGVLPALLAGLRAWFSGEAPPAGAGRPEAKP
jgi:ABC-type transporter Mla subunit MlaD